MNIYEETSLSYLAKVKEILAPKGSGGKFVESASAIVDLEDQIDNDGWTSLHNASAQGHLCIVKYLVESASSVDVDTAYDAAVTKTSFGHLYYRSINQPYDVFTFHISIPIILPENQRASKWQTSYKEDIKLPVGPNSSSITITYTKLQNKQWFWVNEWQIDMSRFYMDSEGWQYARNFTKLDVNWSAHPSQNANSSVRRRRRVHVMKHCFTFTNWYYHLTFTLKQLIPFTKS
ncbi:9010_t:CDS:2 [Entrophospora sp. SA101]|nr:9010_t:CDS:2 [Entrophospora sp. SA101]